MNEFLDRNELCITWNHPLANKSNTYVNHNLNHESCIDHIVVSSNVFNNICSNDVTGTIEHGGCHSACPHTKPQGTLTLFFSFVQNKLLLFIINIYININISRHHRNYRFRCRVIQLTQMFRGLIGHRLRYESVTVIGVQRPHVSIRICLVEASKE